MTEPEAGYSEDRVLFSSLIFLFYFLPATLAVYVLVSFSRTLQNLWLLLVSLVFYAWGEPLFVFIMIGSIFFNWLFGWLVNSARENKKKAKTLLAFAVVVNLLSLFIYKYLGFAVDNINFIAGVELFKISHIPLPLGISFFTFQSMSYVIDVYERTAKVERNPFYVGLYIALFPQLVAGPIVRYADIAHQLRERRPTWEIFASGCARFVIGLGKKTLIANAMGAMADNIFRLSSAGNDAVISPAMLSWLGVIAYTLQIYFDFSAYSDMAIGLGRMFGFEFKENFQYPYISGTVTEFWRRWHISLSTWFKEYLYIPLGGSRPLDKNGHPLTGGRKSAAMVRNTFIVWLATGVWHGADWTFIIWGMWHFMFIMFERATGLVKRPLNPLVAHAYTLFVVMIGWMFFRADNTREAMIYLGNMFAINSNGFYSELAVAMMRENWFYLFCGIVFSTPFANELGIMLKRNALGSWGGVFNTVYPVMLMTLYAVCVVYLAKGSYSPFIYFNF